MIAHGVGVAGCGSSTGGDTEVDDAGAGGETRDAHASDVATGVGDATNDRSTGFRDASAGSADADATPPEAAVSGQDGRVSDGPADANSSLDVSPPADVASDVRDGCPAAIPALGSSCAPIGLSCVYGNVCCGGGRICLQGRGWQTLPVGCPCVLTGDAGLDAGPTCGAATCSADEVCVHPSLSIGGAVPPCVAQPDSGACPTGTQFSAGCIGPGLAIGGCVAIYDPGPPACASVPASCGTSLQCSCFPATICGGGANLCVAITGRDLRCANLAP